MKKDDIVLLCILIVLALIVFLSGYVMAKYTIEPEIRIVTEYVPQWHEVNNTIIQTLTEPCNCPSCEVKSICKEPEKFRCWNAVKILVNCEGENKYYLCNESRWE